MEGPDVQGRRGSQPRPSFNSPSSSRGYSRSSTRTSSRRTPIQSNNDASSDLTPSPSFRNVHYTVTSRRPSRKGSMNSNVDRPPTPISKTSVKGSHSSSQQEPQSTLLQEKLQKERRSEIQRNLNKLAGEINSSSPTTSGTAMATPVRCSTADGRRPEPKDEGGDSGKKKGLALKEMEQAMSTLHKQNFDLKLELFHRRERQAVLEDKVETLEAEKAAAQDSNETLMQELEKRDKAVEEAVHMIISLESRIELLLREREMVRQVEADKNLVPRAAEIQSTSHDNAVESPRASDTTVVKQAQDLTRMPSFLSSHTENTENLRNVYLGTQGSLLSLPRTDPRLENGGFMSPSMSVLSESSFVSIYGKHAVEDSPLHHIDGNSRLMDTPTKSRMNERFSPRDGVKEAIQSGDTAPSLIQDKMETSPLGYEGSQSMPPGKKIEKTETVKPFKPPPLVRVRPSKEKPIPNRRVITDVASARLHNLPPTPDTMSSSMNQSQGSAETLYRDQRTEELGNPGLIRLSADQTKGVESDHWRFRDPDSAQPPSVSAFTGRNEVSAGAYFENRLSTPRRPRSADETTISRHKNGWDSGSEVDDAASEVSSFDCWMREGLRPSNGGVGRAQHRASTTQKMSSRGTPDLFGFPSDAMRWKADDRFRSHDSDGYIGVDAPLAPALDALGASLPAPESGLFGSGVAGPASPRPTGAIVAPPPAPYRRSSLQARAMVPGTPIITRPQKAIGKHHEPEVGRTSSLRGQVQGDSQEWQENNFQSITPTPPINPQNQAENGSGPQKRHYPPTASHQPQQPTTRPRSRGLSSLFRRSLGSGHPQPSASVPANTSPFAPPANDDEGSFPQVGLPAWERRNYHLREEDSATPPPILRKKAPSTDSGTTHSGELQQATHTARSGKTNGPGLGAGLSAVLDAHDGGAPLTSSSQDQDNVSAPVSHGHGRRWFGLGRVAGLKGSGT